MQYWGGSGKVIMWEVLCRSLYRVEVDRPHLLLLIHQAVFANGHHQLQVGKDGSAHEDRDLLHNLDARVSRLPALPGLTDGLEKRQQSGDS